MAQRLLSSSSLCLFFQFRSSRGRGTVLTALKEHPLSFSFSTSTTHTYTNENGEGNREGKPSGEWLTLPPFGSKVDIKALGKQLIDSTQNPEPTQITALKWVAQCCPHIPRNLIQKLFRLRQIRMESLSFMDSHSQGKQEKQNLRLKRVSAKEIMKPGTKLFLPVTVSENKIPQKNNAVKGETISPKTNEIKYIQSLEIYKDPAIIVLNKPPGLAVQGGTGIRKSLDVWAAAALSYDYTEPPRLVHRLDKECSGILVMGRTRESAILLHTLFREKTATTSSADNPASSGRNIKRRYWALVIGIPKQKQGRIVAPLTKVILDDGKSERILIAEGSRVDSAQDAVTDYRVIGPSVHGCTWLELFPLTGRKHQIRVHCAEALGTPIVGDYKYGWSVHRGWSPMSQIGVSQQVAKQHNIPHEANVENGSVLAETPLLHLHCRKLAIPNISKVLAGKSDLADERDSKSEILKFVAPLPSHMAASWDFMSSCTVSQQCSS